VSTFSVRNNFYRAVNCGKDPAPPFNLVCLYLTITAIAKQHCLGVRGLKGQARKAKRDHSEEIGGEKCECVNNFVTDCR